MSQDVLCIITKGILSYVKDTSQKDDISDFINLANLSYSEEYLNNAKNYVDLQTLLKLIDSARIYLSDDMVPLKIGLFFKDFLIEQKIKPCKIFPKKKNAEKKINNYFQALIKKINIKLISSSKDNITLQFGLEDGKPISKNFLEFILGLSYSTFIYKTKYPYHIVPSAQIKDYTDRYELTLFFSTEKYKWLMITILIGVIWSTLILMTVSYLQPDLNVIIISILGILVIVLSGLLIKERQINSLVNEINIKKDRENEIQSKQLKELTQTLEEKILEKTVQLQETSNYLKNILNSSIGTAIIATNLDGIITLFSKGAEIIFGMNASEIENTKTNILFGEGEEIDKFIFYDLMHKFETEDIIIKERNFKTHTGDEFPAILTLTPIKNDQQEIIGILGIITDITELKKLEEKVKIQSEEIEKVLLNMADGVAVINKENKITRINKAGCEIFGVKTLSKIEKESLSILSGFSTIDGTPVTNEATPIDLALKEGKISKNIEIKYISNYDTTKIMSFSTAPLYDSDNNIYGCVAVFRDITEQKNTQKQLQEWTKLLGKRVDARTKELENRNKELIAINKFSSVLLKHIELNKIPSTYVKLINETFDFDITGMWFIDGEKETPVLKAVAGNKNIPSKTLFTHNWSDSFVAQAFKQNKKLTLEELATKPEIQKNDLLIREHISSVVYLPFQRDNSQSGVLGIFFRNLSKFDESKHKLFETIISQLSIAFNNSFLYNKLQTNAEELKRKNEELYIQNLRVIEADRLKGEFLTNISHEIRTPIHAIIGYSEILSTVLKEKIPEKMFTNLERISISANNLLSLINQILDLSKIESGKMEILLGDFYMESVIEYCINIAKNLIKDKPLKIEIENNCHNKEILGDETKISQIIINLLSNAIKFSEKGTITLQTEIDEDNIIIQVRDEGIGIPESEIKHIFDEFRQLDGSDSRRYQGSGLGLSITKKLVEMLSGTIEVHSQPNIGSTFTVTLPLKVKIKN